MSDTRDTSDNDTSSASNTAPTFGMEPERLALLDRCWEHKRVAARAWAREMAAMHLIIAEPARFEELERRAMEAADEHTLANRAADLVAHEIEARFPPRRIEVPDVGAWKPILSFLSGYSEALARKRQDSEPTP